MEAQSETKASKIMKTLAGGGEVGEGSADKREALLGMAKGPPQKKWYSLLWSGSYEFLMTKLNLLLIFMPIGLFFHYIFRLISPGTPDGTVDAVVFICSILVLCPLAERLGFITEEMALYTNDTLSGLLNASFGNATELIICGFSLSKARSKGRTYLRIVQLTLLGSVLGNLLLVLGSAFLVGGLWHPTQSFNREGAAINNGLLVMATGSILLPSTLAATGTQSCGNKNCKGSELALSRFESLFLLGVYTLYLVFQLITHRYLYEGDQEGDREGSSQKDENNLDREGRVVEPAAALSHSLTVPIREEHLPPKNAGVTTMTPRRTTIEMGFATVSSIARETMGSDDEDLDVEEPVLGLPGALIWLTIVTVLISLFSEMVITTIETASSGLRIPMPFLSTIVLPIVGNAAEHASAILFAFKNRMEVTLGVAVGSSTQIAVFVIPVTVLLGWSMGEDLDLNFEIFEAFTLFLAVLLTVTAMNDGTSNWLKGMILVMTYAFISASFWLHYDSDLSGGI